MKTHFFALLLCSAIATAQNKFQLGIGGDLGFGKIELNDQKLNSVTQSASVQVEYSVGYISIDGGLEYVTSWADWSNSGNIYLSEFKSLRIPVGINTRLNFSNSDEP